MSLLRFARSATRSLTFPLTLWAGNEIAGINIFANFHAGVDASEYPTPDTRPKGGEGGGSDDEFELLADDVDLAAVDLDAVAPLVPQPRG